MVTPTFSKPSIGLDAAEAIISVAKEEARAMDVLVTVAVCDESGIIKALSRMDGAALLSVQSAQDKAYTAAGFGIASHKWYPMIKDDPALLHGVVGATERLVIFGGGVPIKVAGKVVGAVGVGGGSHEQDRLIADKAARSVTETLTGKVVGAVTRERSETS